MHLPSKECGSSRKPGFFLSLTRGEVMKTSQPRDAVTRCRFSASGRRTILPLVEDTFSMMMPAAVVSSPTTVPAMMTPAPGVSVIETTIRNHFLVVRFRLLEIVVG